MTHVFLIKRAFDRENGERYFVNGVDVGSTNYDEHASSGMEAAASVFERTAKAIGASFEVLDVEELYSDEE